MKSLESRLIAFMESQGVGLVSLWSAANGLYDNCMQSPDKSNGARIAGIIKAANNSDRLERSGDNIYLRETNK